MPVVACPKCPTKLRVPDGAKGSVRCPKCQAVFPAAPPAAPAFEVVDDAPAAPPASRVVAAKPAPPPPPAPAKDEFEFDDDAPRKKRRRDDDEEDEDDRPRRRRRDEDDEEDDRPRARRRRRDDDEDDEDDRPRRRRGRRRDDDEDEEDWRPARKGNGFGNAATGSLLLTIGLWLYIGMFGVLALACLIGMVTSMPNGLLAVPGLAGAGATVLFLVGLSFCIAGPARARGMAIGAVSVAGAHLVLVVICYSNAGGFERGFGAGFLGGFDWLILGSSLWVLDAVLPVLIYLPKGASLGGEGFLFVLAGACELARCILICLTLKALATAARDHGAADQAGKGVVLTSIVCGAAAGVVLLVVVIISEGKMGRSAMYLAGLVGAAVFAGYAAMNLPAAFAATSVKDSLGRRARRG